MTNQELPDRFVRLPEVLSLTQLNRATISRNVDLGLFPAPFKISERSIAWRMSEIVVWMNELPRSTDGRGLGA